MYLPCAFTEHGAIMAATVLNSKQAVAMSLYVVRGFVKLREQLAGGQDVLRRLAEMDKGGPAQNGTVPRRTGLVSQKFVMLTPLSVPMLSGSYHPNPKPLNVESPMS